VGFVSRSFGVNVFGQARTKEIDNRPRNRVGCSHVGATVPIEDLPAVGQPLDPKLRDAAVADFPFRVVDVLGEDQGVEAVARNRPADQVPAPEDRREILLMCRSSLNSKSWHSLVMVSAPCSGY
jgi:hypothetical protein